MKKIIILFTTILLMFVITLCGCSSSAQKYYKYDMGKYITISDYKAQVDSSSQEFKDYYDEIIDKNLSYKVESGEVADNDVANIDYVGYLNGKAFDGGTANGYNLKIGSNTFIDGFESQLIGAKVGETKELHLTFPSTYAQADLRDKDVIFSVKVNYITRVAELTDENARKVGFDSALALADKADKHAVVSVAWKNLLNNIQILDYPKKEINKQFKETLDAYNVALEAENLTFKDYATKNNMTVAELQDKIKKEEVSNMVATNMVYYGLLQKAGYKLTADDINKASEFIKTESAKNNFDFNAYSDMYIESYAAYTAASEILFMNAQVK